MTPDILFDNFIITNDKFVADKWASDRYKLTASSEPCDQNLIFHCNIDALLVKQVLRRKQITNQVNVLIYHQILSTEIKESKEN